MPGAVTPNAPEALLAPTLPFVLYFASPSCQDGSVLLAKYLEHQAIPMRRDLDTQRPGRRTRPISAAPERAESNGDVMNAAAVDETNHGLGKRARPVARVLELGCGTGLAGLAAAFSLGTGQSSDSDNEGRVALPCPHRHSKFCAGETNELVEGASSPTAEHGVEVVLTDLGYALENARANIDRNASSLEAVGGTVKAMELDWCRPLPDEFAGEKLLHRGSRWFPAGGTRKIRPRLQNLCMMGVLFSTNRKVVCHGNVIPMGV